VLLFSTHFLQTLVPFPRVFTNSLQTVSPFFTRFLCEPQWSCTTLSCSSWVASEIQPCATELCSLPLRDQITGRGSNITCCVQACFLHRLLSVYLLNMLVGSNSILLKSTKNCVGYAIVRSDRRKSLECCLP